MDCYWERMDDHTLRDMINISSEMSLNTIKQHSFMQSFDNASLQQSEQEASQKLTI